MAKSLEPFLGPILRRRGSCDHPVRPFGSECSLCRATALPERRRVCRYRLLASQARSSKPRQRRRADAAVYRLVGLAAGVIINRRCEQSRVD